MSSIIKGLVDEQGVEETKKLSAQEKFKRSMKRAGYDMDAGAKRLQDLLAKQKKEREEFEKKEVKEDETLQYAAEVTPKVSPYAGVKDNKFRGAIGEGIKQMFENPNESPTDSGYQQGGWRKMNEQEVSEDLRKWFKEKWVRFGPDGKIRGACARGDDSEGKPKCLPQAKAHALGKKGRKYAAAKKRREDPNPERSGPAKNVATKKKSKSESINEGLWDWIKDKLSNKKPIQWSENYYDFIIRNDPLYLQAYLNAVKNDPNYIEWKKNNPSPAQQSTSQTNYTGSQNRPEQYQARDDFTAPHGSSENELKMFINGQKPAAIVPEPNFSSWAKVINSGKYWTKQLLRKGKLDSIIIVQPGNEESGKQIYELVQNAMNLANQGDFRAYENSNYHRRLGKLLGYPKDKVEQWINNYFKDKVDLAKTKIDEQDLNETFDQPYKLKWYPGDMDEVTAYAEIPNGDDLSIMFNLDANEEGEEAWAVEFYRNDSQKVTGEGDAQRIFATVLSAIKTFIKKYKPNRITFSASKEVEQGQKIQSRANLYDRLVQRYASTLGYKAFRADTGNKVIYELSKIAKKVAEGSDYEREPLYHATLKAFEPSITRSGLMPGGNLRMFDWSDKNYVYLSNYPDIARDFVDPDVIEPSEDHEKQILKLMKQGGVILKIDQNKLDRKLLSVDPHFQRDEDTGVETYVYSGIISPNAIISKEYFPININESMQGVAEGYNGRETKDGTWRVFKDGKAVAVAGPFKSREEAAAWIKKQKQGVAEGFSDISGLLSASNLNKSFIITAELAEGGRKKFRVKAQNERVAIEKFKKHHSMAKIIDVAEEGVEEGSKYPRNPASYHLKKYPVPQDQLARPVKKKDEKVDKDKPKEIKEGTDEVRRIQQFLNKNFNANLDVDGVMGNLTLQSIKKFLPAAKEKLAPNPNKNTKVQGYQNKNQVKEAEIDEACWKGYHKEGNKKMFGKTYPNCVKNTNEEQLDEKCWDTHKQVGMKNKGGKMVPNCVPKESVEEGHQQCPECGGAMYEVSLMNEKKDACYYKVKSRYKVWPSAYASGALVKCRKKGAKNWGSKSKSNEGQIYSTGGGAGQAQRYYTPKDNLGETKSNILFGLKQVDEGLKSRLAGAALAAAMAAGGSQARVSIGPDGQLTPSFAQHLGQQSGQSSVEPAGGTIERTQGITVNREDQTLEYKGKTYSIIRITKDGPQPRIARFDAKITVPMADLGFRGIGTLPTTLAGDSAYVYLP